MLPTTVEEHKYMSHVPYVSVVGDLMYAIVCTRPDLSQAVSMVNRYIHDPGSKVNFMVHQKYHKYWISVREGYYE